MRSGKLLALLLCCAQGWAPAAPLVSNLPFDLAWDGAATAVESAKPARAVQVAPSVAPAMVSRTPVVPVALVAPMAPIVSPAPVPVSTARPASAAVKPSLSAPAPSAETKPADLPQASPAVDSAPPVLAAGTAAIGAGDVLQVTVFGQPDMSAEVSVTEGGEVTLPLIGLIRLAGLSSSDVEKLVARRLREREFLLNPEVSVTVRQNRSQVVSVLGEVVKPGRYPIQGRFTVLDLLATAGGLTPKADTVAFLLRKGDGSAGGAGAGSDPAQRIRIPIRLDRVNTPDRSSLDLVLSNDDMVYVGQQKFFYILGEVRRPGSYPMEPDLNVMRALSISGGVTERGSMNRINIHRQADAPNGRELAPRLTDSVMEGDVIYVKERIF